MQRVRSRAAPRQARAGMALVLAATLAGGCGKQQPAAQAQAPAPAYAPQLQHLLDEKLRLLAALARETVIQEAVNAANSAGASLSTADIMARDRQWQRAGADDAFTRALQENAAARRLAAFCEAHLAFPEVFVTDRRGLVVAMSNRTSDYLQADEDWWQRAYAQGRGHAHAGEIEYDESAHSQAIALCLPVPATTGSQIAGVIKAVFDVKAVKAEL